MYTARIFDYKKTLKEIGVMREAYDKLYETYQAELNGGRHDG